MKIGLLAIVTALACAAHAEEADSGPPTPVTSPAPSALNLKLAVSADKPQKHWHVNVTLKNTSLAPIILSDGDSGHADYSSALKASLQFQVKPVPFVLGAQAAGGSHRESPLTYTLEAGKELTLDWKLGDARIHTPWDYSETAPGPIRFPADGDYAITCTAELLTNLGKASLQSNEVHISVGPDSNFAPALTGGITAVDESKQTVELNIGAGNGVREGDVYWRMPPTLDDPSVWELTVTSAGKAYSQCSVKLYPMHLQHLPAFPKKGQDIARGVPQKQVETKEK